MTTCTQPSLITSSVTGSFFGCAMSPMSEDSVKNLLYPRVANILAQKNLVATMRWDARTENVTNRITNDYSHRLNVLNERIQDPARDVWLEGAVVGCFRMLYPTVPSTPPAKRRAEDAQTDCGRPVKLRRVRPRPELVTTEGDIQQAQALLDAVAERNSAPPVQTNHRSVLVLSQYKKALYITGDTHLHKYFLKHCGMQWNSTHRAWFCAFSQRARIIAQLDARSDDITYKLQYNEAKEEA